MTMIQFDTNITLKFTAVNSQLSLIGECNAVMIETLVDFLYKPFDVFAVTNQSRISNHPEDK